MTSLLSIRVRDVETDIAFLYNNNENPNANPAAIVLGKFVYNDRFSESARTITKLDSVNKPHRDKNQSLP
jgi:hypothetical protein